MKFINLEYHPADSRIKIVNEDICQSLSARMGTGGNNVPLIICFIKSRRAQNPEDYETWVEGGCANTINPFDVSEVRATNLVVIGNDLSENDRKPDGKLPPGELLRSGCI